MISTTNFSTKVIYCSSLIIVHPFIYICFNNYFITMYKLLHIYTFVAVLSLSLQVGGRKVIEH
jgi:hypothetical protein